MRMTAKDGVLVIMSSDYDCKMHWQAANGKSNGKRGHHYGTVAAK